MRLVACSLSHLGWNHRFTLRDPLSKDISRLDRLIFRCAEGEYPYWVPERVPSAKRNF